jgi:hypothetical protein
MTGSTATAPVPRTAKSAESPFAGVPIPAILEAFPGFPHLNAMLRRAGLEPSVVPVRQMRELQWTCLLCASHRECSRWLRSDPAETLPEFCANAGTLKLLRSRC